jgi:hypothetical protein
MTYIPSDWYEIFIYDYNNKLYATLRGWDRFEFTQRRNGAWNHLIEFKLSSDDPRVTLIRNIRWFYKIYAYRTDPITGVRTRVYEGFCQTLVDQAEAQGNVLLTMYGDGFSRLIRHRCVIPPTGTKANEKSGTTEGVMKAYFADCFINTSTDRQIPNLSIEFNEGAGGAASYSANYTKLESVLEALGKMGRLDYGIYGGAEIGQLIFRVRPLWGIDRTENNTEGNKPTIFDMTLGNMAIPIFSRNRSEERNIVYVGGQGQDEDREIIVVANSESATYSPYSRIEMYQDAREAVTAVMVTDGKAQLMKYGFAHRLDFDIIQTHHTRWLRDWSMGDLITAKYYGDTFTRQIDEVTTQVTAGSSAKTAENIRVVFIDPEEVADV